MELREGRAYLGRVRRLESRIRRKVMQIEALRASLLPGAIRYDTDQVQTSPSDKIGEVEARIDELEREVIELMGEKRRALLEMIQIIDSIDGELEREVLTAFYIREKRVREIAEEMHYTTRGINKIMERGIAKL